MKEIAHPNVQTVEPARAAAWYAVNFAAFEKRLNGESASAVHGIRRRAMEQFRATGFPGAGEEEWRFTDVTPYVSIPYRPVLDPIGAVVRETELGKMALKGLPGVRLVFVNGHFAPELSLLGAGADGLQAASLWAALSPGAGEWTGFLGRNAGNDTANPFTALNTAFLHDGVFLRVPPGYTGELPVYMLFFSTQDPEPFCTHPRNLIIAGEGSRIAIVEEYYGSGPHPYFTNSVTEVFAQRGASVEYDRFQHEAERSFHVSSLYVRQEEGSSVTVNTVSYGSAMARHNVVSVLDGERSECTLNGLTLTTGSQHIDNHTVIDHAKPNCTSHELYKAILEGSSRGVFNGKIFVRRDAQKTDAKQTNRSLLLSDDATIDTKPQLEIFADDVRCTHGATVGQLDEEQIFYLRSRGIGHDDARDLLTNAFASDVLNRIRLEPLREHLQAILHVRLCKGRILAAGGV